MDDRYSGSWEGRIQTRAIYREKSILDPNAKRPTLSDKEWEMFRRIARPDEYLKLRERFGEGGGVQ